MAGIKVCLKRLTEENIDMNINKHIKFLLESTQEDQIVYKLQQTTGIKLDGNMIQLNYTPGLGFQCRNLFQERYGRLPICGKIQSFLNEELHKL